MKLKIKYTLVEKYTRTRIQRDEKSKFFAAWQTVSESQQASREKKQIYNLAHITV